MPHDAPPPTGASPESIQRGYETLTTKMGPLGLTMLIFIIVAGGMLAGLLVLMGHYLTENQAEDAAASVARPLPADIRAPLEPMPAHNDADWQDLLRLRQRENAQFRQAGWQVSQTTGQEIIPPAVAQAVLRRYSQGAAARAEHFPTPMAPVPPGPQESIDWANLFPPLPSVPTSQPSDLQIHIGS